MTVGNGNQVIKSLIEAGVNNQLPQWLYIQSGFARMALLAICMNCGFIGGVGFPVVTMGFIAGTVTILKFPSLPPGLVLSCWMAAAPLGFIPMPYTFTVLSCLTFQLNSYQSSVVFVSALSSYLIMSGSGIISTLQKNSMKKEAEARAEEARLAVELANAKPLQVAQSPSSTSQLTNSNAETSDGIVKEV